MIESVKKWFKRIGYMFAFGMKGGDTVLTPNDQDEATVSIVQQQQAKSLGEALINGEVTKQVEELRYSDYRVSRESKRYHYIGNGVSVATRKPEKNLKHFKFKQGNTMVCEDVYHELKRVGSYGNMERYTFEFVYVDVPTVRLEAYVSYGEFEIDENHITVSLVFDKNIRTNEDPVSKIILRRLGEINRYTDGHQIENDDICSNIAVMSFTTMNATNEDDYVRYDIFGVSFDSCKELSDAFVLKYTSSNFKRIDLTDKYYSKEMDDKYKNKEPKVRDITLGAEERKYYCDDCGKEINSYDANITKSTFGRQLCQDCIKANMLY